MKFKDVLVFEVFISGILIVFVSKVAAKIREFIQSSYNILIMMKYVERLGENYPSQYKSVKKVP